MTNHTAIVEALTMSDLHMAVLRSNGGRCIACGMVAEQVDHIKPKHAGGADTPENLAPICAECNKIKSCLWYGHGYHPWPGFNDLERAREILETEIEWSIRIYGPAWLEVDYIPRLHIISWPIHLPRRWNGAFKFTSGHNWCLYPDQGKPANWSRRAAPPLKPVRVGR